MTLSAMTEDRLIFNPSIMIEEGDQESIVVTEMRQREATGLYCPHCFRSIGKLFQVRFRNTDTNRARKHFYHVDGLGEKSECSHWSKESEAHLSAKAALARYLENIHSDRDIQIKLDEQWLFSDTGKRKPDVLVIFPNGAMEAHEIQVSYINSKDLNDRTVDLREMGCQRVNWYLYGSQYNTENRDYLRRYAIPCYHLHRRDDVWRWQLDESDAAKPKKLLLDGRSIDRDDCTRDLADRYQPTSQHIYKGDRVTNDLGWDGYVTKIDLKSLSNGGDYYWVHWQEREHYKDKAVSRNPVCGHTSDQIRLWSVAS